MLLLFRNFKSYQFKVIFLSNLLSAKSCKQKKDLYDDRDACLIKFLEPNFTNSCGHVHFFNRIHNTCILKIFANFVLKNLQNFGQLDATSIIFGLNLLNTVHKKFVSWNIYRTAPPEVKLFTSGFALDPFGVMYLLL